jgi:hypothetical protein
MTTPACPSYAGHRFPAEIISYAVWLYFRFPLSLRHVDEILAARGITVSHETVRQWGLKFGQSVANQIRRRLPRAGDTWHLDEVAVKIAGKKHWGIVNLIDCGRADTHRSDQTHGSLCQSDNPGDLGPGLEGLGPCGSILGGGKVIAAEVEEVVDLIMGREETLGLPG